MNALRPPLVTHDGRSGFFCRVIRKLVTTCASMEECVGTMAVHQDLYSFPTLFRSPK